MKFKIMVFDKKNILMIMIFIIASLILLYSIFRAINIEKNENIGEIKNKQIENVKKTSSDISMKQATEKLKNKIDSNAVELKEYAFMPQYIEGFLVIGELKIPSINLDTFILNETSNKALNVSVTKLAGAKINEVGNFCITGHNYLKDNMFGRLKKVNIGDQIILIDTFGKQKEYKVYEKNEISPDDISVLNQDTNGKVEVTLITCTTGAKRRIIVRAVAI